MASYPLLNSGSDVRAAGLPDRTVFWNASKRGVVRSL